MDDVQVVVSIDETFVKRFPFWAEAINSLCIDKRTLIYAKDEKETEYAKQTFGIEEDKILVESSLSSSSYDYLLWFNETPISEELAKVAQNIISALSHQDDINERIDCFRKNGIERFICDFLPDEVPQFVTDENNLFYIEGFIFLHPEVTEHKEDLTNKHTEPILVYDNDYNSKPKLNNIISVLKDKVGFSTLEYTKAIKELQLMNPLGSVITNCVNPQFAHYLLLNGVQDVIQLDENSIFSPLRHYFIEKNYNFEGYELVNTNESLRSKLQPCFMEWSAKYTEKSPYRDINIISSIINNVQIEGLVFDLNILRNSYNYRESRINKTKEELQCNWLNNRNTLYFIESVLSVLSKNDTTQPEIYKINEFLLNAWSFIHVFDYEERFNRNLVSLAKSDVSIINPILNNLLYVSQICEARQYRLLLRSALNRISRLSFLLKCFYKKEINEDSIATIHSLKPLINNNDESVTLSLIIFMLCKGLDDEVTILVKSQTETIFYQNTIISTSLLYAILGQYSKAEPLIKQIQHDGIKSQKEKCLASLLFLGLFQNVDKTSYSKIPVESVAAIENLPKHNLYSHFPFYLLIPMAQKHSKEQFFFYYLYRVLQNASILDEDTIDYIYQNNPFDIDLKELCKIVAILTGDSFLDEKIPKHDKDLPPFLSIELDSE